MIARTEPRISLGMTNKKGRVPFGNDKKSLGAFAEDGRAYADRGGAFFDGYAEVVGHAHGELGELGEAGEVFVAEAAEMLEVGAGRFGILRPGGDRHEAAGFDVCEGRQGFE